MYRLTIFAMWFLQLLTSLGLLTGGVGALILGLEQSVKASGAEVHPTPLPWYHDAYLASFDHARFVIGQNLEPFQPNLDANWSCCYYLIQNQYSSRLRSIQKCLRCMPWLEIRRLASFGQQHSH